MIRFTKARAKPVIKAGRKPGEKHRPLLEKLRSFLEREEPDVIEILLRMWQGQENAVTYKEIREAYLAGAISQDQIEAWQRDYSRMVSEKLLPKFQEAADEAAEEMAGMYPGFLYEPHLSESARFAREHGAELVTNLSMEQRDAVNAMIRHVTGYTQATPDEAARMIRPCIGLTKPQALANMRYREKVKEAYLKENPRKLLTAEGKAKEAAARYAARQHRYRAMSIARTEMAYAYNAGHYGATLDAQRQGFIGDCVKTWVNAGDAISGRMCETCQKMDGESVNINDYFSCGVMLPPLHPHCRCAVAYEEIEGTGIGVGQFVETNEPAEHNDYSDTLTVPNESDIIISGLSITRIVEGQEGTPKSANPYDVIDHLGIDGKTETRTYYGSDGRKSIDITNHNHGNAKHHPFGEHGEHAHEYTWNSDGTLRDRTTRNLSEQERKDNEDML